MSHFAAKIIIIKYVERFQSCNPSDGAGSYVASNAEKNKINLST